MYEKIPNELKNLKQWCCYKITPDEAREGKFKKLPVNSYTGGNAQSNNEQTWSDFDTAVQAVDKLKLDGIGFFFANGYFGVDIDNASDLIADYKLGEENLISEFIHSLQSYSELSVSKTGIHIICKGKLPPKGRRKGNVEMYQQGRFFIMTGNQISEYTDISECTETIKSLHEKYIGGGTEPQAVVVRSNDLDMSEKEIIELASKSKQGPFFIDLLNGNWQGFFTSQSEADISFCNMLAFWTSCDYNKMDGIFRSSGLMREKWERRQANSTYGAITLNKAISGCTDVYTPSEQYAIQINEDKQKSKPRKLYSMDDTGNAERLFDSFKDSLRYSYINKGWIYYDGRKWCVDDTGMIKRATDDILQLMRKDTDLYSNGDEEAFKAFNKHLKTSRSSNSKNAMANELKHKLPILPEQLDKNSFLLNTPNGELNLKNGELKNHDVNDFITKITNVEYTDKMEPTRWIQFLNEIFDNDQDLIKYMQKAVGYSLTGDTTEQCCFFCFGTGKNGKSVFLETVTSILGDYASNIQPESIMIKNTQSSASSDIARLKGSRFVTSEEPNEGVRLNEGLVKQLTGSDRVTARHLYGNEFEFRPEFKLWIGTNHKPIIRGTDTGIWRRLHLIPFKVQIPDDKVDKNLKHKLIQEYPAILKWCIDGALIWQKEGLKKPLAVEESTKEYRQEMDVISSFLDECTMEGYQYHTSAADLYNSYKQWADENNEYKFTNSKFGREVSKRYEKTRRSGGNYYVGIKVTNVYNVKIG